MTRKRRLPPVKRTRVRKGNHPSNPYPVPEARHEDRDGWPFPGPSHLRPERGAQAGLIEAASRQPPSPPQSPAAVAAAPDPEPTFTLRASDPLAGMMVRFWANANERHAPPEILAAVRRLALAMDEWRAKNNSSK